jgi:predicted dehydrogenase
MPLNFAGLQKDSGFGNSWTWWTNPASVGHIINGGTHAIDLLRWFMDSEVMAVTALSRTFRQNSTVEDTTMALFNFENGAICSLFSSCALPGVTFPGEGFRVRIMGTSGLLDLDLFGELKIADHNGWRLVCTQPPVGHDDSNSAFLPVRIQAYRDQLSAFLQAIRGEPSECGTGRDGIAGVEACLAAIEASRKEAVIHLPAAS